MLRSIYFLTFVSIFATFSLTLGCSETVNNYYPEEDGECECDDCEECDECSDDDDSEEPGDDDDSAEEVDCSFFAETWDVAEGLYGQIELANELVIELAEEPDGGLVEPGDIAMTRLHFTAVHEQCPDIEVRGFGMFLDYSDIAETGWAEELADLSTVWAEDEDGNIVGSDNGSDDYPNGWYPYLDSFTIPAGTTVSLTFYADLTDANAATNGDTARLDLQADNLSVIVDGVWAPLAQDQIEGPEFEIDIEEPVEEECVAELSVIRSGGSPEGTAIPGFIETLRFEVTASGSDTAVLQFPFFLSSSDTAGSDWNRCEQLSDPAKWALFDLSDPEEEILVGWDFRNDLLGQCDDTPDSVFGYAMAEIYLGYSIQDGMTKTFSLYMETSGASADWDDTVRTDIAPDSEFLWYAYPNTYLDGNSECTSGISLPGLTQTF